MPKDKKEDTKPVASDDDAMKRLKDRQDKLDEQMKKLFSDNETGRYSKEIKT